MKLFHILRYLYQGNRFLHHFQVRRTWCSILPKYIIFCYAHAQKKSSWRKKSRPHLYFKTFGISGRVTMAFPIKVSLWKRVGRPSKLTIVQVPVRNVSYKSRCSFFLTVSGRCEGSVVIGSGFILFIRNLCPFWTTNVHSQPVTVFSPLFSLDKNIPSCVLSWYYIPVRLFIRDTFFQLSPVRPPAVRTNEMEFSNSFDW